MNAGVSRVHLAEQGGQCKGQSLGCGRAVCISAIPAAEQSAAVPTSFAFSISWSAVKGNWAPGAGVPGSTAGVTGGGATAAIGACGIHTADLS